LPILIVGLLTLAEAWAVLVAFHVPRVHKRLAFESTPHAVTKELAEVNRRLANFTPEIRRLGAPVPPVA